jgi:hypothetical protein
MSSLPPLDVNVSSRKISCVLDGELAMSRQGLLLALRLAEEANIWLFPALWRRLDNSQVYPIEQVGTAVADWPGPDETHKPRRREASPCTRAEQQWELTRLATDLAGLRFFFVGDARHESLLPKDVGTGLVDRFESLAAELDTLYRGRGEAEPVYDPVYECNRDTIALATALIRYRPIVLSKSSRGGKEEDAGPAVCNFLRCCGIACRPAARDGTLNSIRGYLQPIFARSGVAELLWDLQQDGGELVILHIIAPHAVVMPIEAELNRRYGEGNEFAPVADEIASCFSGASAYWWKYG